LRHDRRRSAGGRTDKEPRSHGATDRSGTKGKEETDNQNTAPAPLPPVSSSPPDHALLIEALRALLAADNDSEFSTILAENPTLLDDDADPVVRDLADLAYANGERDVSAALREL